MILWQKRATPRWLAANEQRLEWIAGSDLAVISRPGRMLTLVQVVCRARARAEKLVRKFGGILRSLPSNRAETTQSQKPRAPIRIGRRLEIVSEPTDSARAGHRSRLIIPAAGAFGTGEHATTAMSLRLLEEATRNTSRRWRVLDVGTGTGILALAARRLGAAEVLGLDHDPCAVAHARRNARLNRLSHATFVAADVMRWKSTGRYDLISANLFSELLIAALPVFRRALDVQGSLIVSGILRAQAESVCDALRRAGFHLQKKRRRGRWIALLAAPKTQLKAR